MREEVFGNADIVIDYFRLGELSSRIGGALISTLRISAFLCASAVITIYRLFYRRDAEERKDTQRGNSIWVTTKRNTGNLFAQA